MDTLVWLLFESLPALGAVLAILLFVLLVISQRRGRMQPLLYGLIGAALLLCLQTVVVTQREHAQRIMKNVEHAVRISQVTPLAEKLSTEFQAGFMARETFVDFVREFMEDVHVRLLQRRDFIIKESQRDRFTIEVSYFAMVTFKEFERAISSRWKIEFVRVEGAWEIGRIEPISFNQKPASWADLTR